MYCLACGIDNRPGASFCRNCGVRLSGGLALEALPADRESAPVSTPPLPEGVEEDTRALEEAGVAGVGGVPARPGERAAELGSDLPGGPPGSETVAAEEVAEIWVESGAPEAATAPAELASPEPEAGLQPGGIEAASLPAGGEQEGASLATETGRQGQQAEAAGDLAAVAVGTVISGRYRVVSVLAGEGGAVQYQAEDLRACGQCGFEGHEAEDAFCAQCGASLASKLTVTLMPVPDPDLQAHAGERVLTHVSEAGHHYLVVVPPADTPGPWPTGQEIRLLVGQRSHPGQVRELDEDSLLSVVVSTTYESRTSPVFGLFAVADGMGGHEGGEVASKLALQILTKWVLETILLPELTQGALVEGIILQNLKEAMIAANDAVYLARQKAHNDMGTTLTTALVRDDRLFLAHVGDCRAYRWSAEGLQPLTVDHSLVASMVASGQVAPEEIYTHPHRSVIYRCIGDQPEVEVDTDVHSIRPGERILLCCDGLWEMVREEGIRDMMMQEADPQAACDRLVSQANLAGGDDNISVIIVQVEGLDRREGLGGQALLGAKGADLSGGPLA
jgi:serine/threonine protein phosphatase PrpC